ncbi:MAG: transcriptional regulator FilR1 domain-containing protein [Promethearchaeota archaeon]
MDITDFLIEFTNKGRYKVFKSIFNSNKRHSQLEKDLKIPGPEISRNIKRLMKKKLIEKTVDNEYQITSTGILFYEIFRIVEKILTISEFFNDHDINSIPLNLILQLGKLTSIKINDKTMKNVQKWAELVKESEVFIIAISEQFQDSILPIIEKKINNQEIEIKSIIDISLLKDSVKIGKSFKDRHEVYDKMDAFTNVRVLNEIGLALLASEKGSIVFLSKEGKIDYSQCLHDDSKEFIEWTKELFKWYWKKGKSLKPFIKK